MPEGSTRGRGGGAYPVVPLADPDALAAALLAAGKVRAAAEELVRVHGERIRRYLRAIVRDGDLADDAYSVWSEWVLTRLGGYRGEAPLRTWAYGVAHNAARRVRDDAYRRRRCSLSRAGASRVPDPAASSARRRERSAEVLDAIRARLTLDDQGLLTLRVDHGLDWETVSAILSPWARTPTNAAALRKRYERLKARIRQLATEAGGLE